MPTISADVGGQERFFANGYERRVLPVVGHFIPREAPDERSAEDPLLYW